MVRKFFLVLVIPLIFLLDRVLKIWILRRYAEGETVSVIPKVFYLTRVNNTGAAFGMLKGSGDFLAFGSLAAVVLLSVVLWRNLFSARQMDRRICALDWASPLIIAGALGNLYDRLRYGYVVDFLDFRFWPVFNLADISICLGVFLIAFYFFGSRLRRGS